MYARLSSLILLLLILTPSVMGATAHLDAGRCADCHALFELEEGLPMLQVRSATLTALCEDCHAGAAIQSHAVGMTPSVSLPGAYPLDPDGGLSCLSCHRLHGSGAATLREPANGPFCGGCHDQLGSTPHVEAAQVAHGGFRSTRESRRQGLTESSRRCLGCHDGLGSGEAYHRNTGTAAERLRGNHPVGVVYAAAGMRTWDLAPAGEIAPLRLEEGRVACLSCHDPYLAGPHKLVLDTRDSRLCLKCHRKDLSR
jgi:predicted CXXCH cytochrome family protein